MHMCTHAQHRYTYIDNKMQKYLMLEFIKRWMFCLFVFFFFSFLYIYIYNCIVLFFNGQNFTYCGGMEEFSSKPKAQMHGGIPWSEMGQTHLLKIRPKFLEDPMECNGTGQSI